MISLVKREDYSSEIKYQKAYKQMLKNIKQHNINNSEPKYDPNFKETFLKSIQSKNQYLD